MDLSSAVFFSVFISYIVYIFIKNLSSNQSVLVVGLFYWLRRWICFVKIYLEQLKLPKRLNNYQPYSLNYDISGFVPTPTEEDLENPKLLVTDRHEDGISMWGGDNYGRTAVIKVVRLSLNRACAYFLLRDKDGTLYTLPDQPETNFVNMDNEINWRAGGLFLECVEPMRTWRALFNGPLRRLSPKHQGSDANENEEDIVEVKVNFLWKALKAPVDMWKDQSPWLMADALARETNYCLSSLRSLDRDGYDQLGVLQGTVSFNTEDSMEEWYLRGIRQHKWGMSDSATNLHRSVNLYAYFSDGDAIWVEGFSYKALVSHCVMGYVLRASGYFHPVTMTNLELSEIKDPVKQKNILIQLKAGGMTYSLWHHLEKGISVHTGTPWTLEHQIIPSYTATTNWDGFGLVIFTQRFKGNSPPPLCSILPTVTTERKSNQKLENDLILPLDNKKCQTSSLSGGKGASLAFLTEISNIETEEKLLVPRGIVITSNAWKKQTSSNSNIQIAINSLEKAITSALSSQIQETCSKVVQVIKNSNIFEEVKNNLEDSLEDIFSSSFRNRRFAVRSSACGEDSTEASAAGQNATFLGCFWNSNQEENSVLKAVLHCWASQFTYQSVEYRRQRGQLLDGGMAVIIQEMVSAEAAGVIFTRDPVTGSPSKITITCNYGLGESVVSGQSEPDTFVVHRSWRNELKFDNKTIGEKKLKTIMDDNGGTSEISVSDSQKNEFSLDDSTVLKLSKLSIFIEEAFGSPRDIEFAVKEGNIYLLQSRPITSTEEWSDYAIMHEMDSTVLSDKDIFTIHNTGEVLPGYTSPLTITSVVKALDLGSQRVLQIMWYPTFKFDTANRRTVSCFNSTCMLNLGEIYYQASIEKEISIINHVIDMAIMGEMTTTEEIRLWGMQRYGIRNIILQFYQRLLDMYYIIMNHRTVKKISPIYSKYSIDVSRAKTAQTLYKEICKRLPDFYNICATHAHTSSSSTMAQCILLVILTQKRKDLTQDMIHDMTALLSCVVGTESGDVPTALKELATQISKCDEADDFLLMTPDEGKVWLESHPGPVGKNYNAFMEKHGHRCYKEFDLHTKSWGLAPESLVTCLQKMVPLLCFFKKSDSAMNFEKAINSMNTTMQSSTRRVLKFMLNRCESAVKLREATKSMLIRTVDGFRKAYRTLGHLMVSECRLPDSDLIFYFAHREIGLLLETRSATLIMKALKRRKLQKELENYKYPDISFGVPKHIKAEDSMIQLNLDSKYISGTPVGLGCVKGTARVVLSLEDAFTIQNGDILVTFSTDVGWTPYFPLLSGVITEIGGLISHGAVVAREYGLPCIVGAKGATSLLVSGDEVLLDATKGRVIKISKEIAKENMLI